MVTAISFDNGAFSLVSEPMLPVAANGLSLRIRHAETRLPWPETTMTLEADDDSELTVTLRGVPPVRNCLEFEPRRTVPAVPPGMSSTAEITLGNGCEVDLRIVDIRPAVVPIASDISNAYIDFSKMTASVVAVVTDVERDGKPVIGYGFGSNGRYAQGGILRERLIPRRMPPCA